MENISVDLGYGYVKVISSFGKRVAFPSLVGNGSSNGLTNIFGKTMNNIENMHVHYNDEEYFIGELAKEARSVSRIFDRERFRHVHTKIQLNAAIQLVTDSDIVRVSTGLPLDFYQSQAKAFKNNILGMQPVMYWQTGPLALAGKERRINIDQALVLPQGASAIFSALINHEGKYNYPYLVHKGNLVALIDIGFRTTDFVVVQMQENGSFVPITKLSGTVDEGITRDIQQAYKEKTGGADLKEFYISRVLQDEFITYRGKRIDFSEVIQNSKASIATNISDRLKGVWEEDLNLFNAIFLAGGGGELIKSFIQPHLDNRLELIKESQFANAIGYLRLGKNIFEQQQKLG